MAKIIAVYNFKGGAGKTTTASGLAYALSAAGHSTLLVDADPQACATEYLLSIYHPKIAPESVTTLYELLKYPINHRTRKLIDASPPITLAPNFALLAGTPLLIEYEIQLSLLANLDTELQIVVGSAFRFILLELQKKYNYSHIVIDFSPSASPLNLTLLSNCDTILPPLCPDLSLAQPSFQNPTQTAPFPS